jgi:hypothetical protein
MFAPPQPKRPKAMEYDFAEPFNSAMQSAAPHSLAGTLILIALLILLTVAICDLASGNFL